MSLVLVLAVCKASACGPYVSLIPDPDFFTSRWDGHSTADFERAENIRLWQELTSHKISPHDIEEAVYNDSWDKAHDRLREYRKHPTRNGLYAYIHNSNDEELSHFLLLAKDLERRRQKRTSPWYYPSSKNHGEEKADFSDIIEECKGYKGHRLRDRYALQAIRALFASRSYDECIEYYTEAFRQVEDDNLFKRMAMRYVAGCWSRLGNVEKADDYFLQAGSLRDMVGEDAVERMAEHNPDCPELMAGIQNSTDTALIPLVEKVLREGKAKNRGDWEFAPAYITSEGLNDHRKALHHLNRALRCKFSSEDFRDHARAYRMKVNSRLGKRATLLADLKWLESKTDLIAPDAREWNRILRHIVYIDLVPSLWERRDYATAILLCGYADRMYDSKVRYSRWEAGEEVDIDNVDYLVCGDPYWYESDWHDESSTLISVPRDKIQYERENVYGSLAFQMMGSLSSSQLIAVKRKVASHSPLYTFLKRHARTDAPFFDELIGTLALREDNYRRAVHYLARVPKGYTEEMNIHFLLERNPFRILPDTLLKDFHDYEASYEQNWGTYADKYDEGSIPYANSKYTYAKKMLHYQRQMKYARTADQRGIARLRYAIGRFNSYEYCWALTQYWRGDNNGSRFCPNLEWWWGEEEALHSYDFLYDYQTKTGYDLVHEEYQREKQQALFMLQSDEAKAEAEYLLHNLRTIIKRYGNTAVACDVKSSCDNWRNWL